MFEQLASVVLVVTGIVYALVEVFKPIWDPTKRANLGDLVAALIFAELICVAGFIDAFPLVGIPLAVPYLGSVLTGFLMVGGGKGLHDGIKLLKPKT